MGTKKFVIIGLVVLILVGFVLVTNQATPGKYDSFAKCLGAKDAKMYGAYWCSHCQNQKKEFGNSFQYVNYVECDAAGTNPQPQLCTAAGIRGYPTWVIDGKKYEGELSLDEIATYSGCTLN
jgi:hypothetical protein